MRIRLRSKFVILTAVVVSLFAYTKLMARIGAGSPPPDAPLEQQADLIRVYKAERRMILLKGDTPSQHTGFLLGRLPMRVPSNEKGTRKHLKGVMK